MQQLKAFMGGDDDHDGVGGEGEIERGRMEFVDAAGGGARVLRHVPTCL